MPRIHWFNPENDLALALGAVNYTPPRAARILRACGAALPLWYGQEGDRVICGGIDDAWYRSMADAFGLGVDVYGGFPDAGLVPDPWGWSAYARRFFLREGFDPSLMPDERKLCRLRDLSHRRTSVEVARRLAASVPGCRIGAPAVEAFDIGTVRDFISAHGEVYIKHPWSGSGRGVLSTASASAEAALKFADDALRLQGSVLLEPGYRRRVDFARIYRCRGGVCHDLGTSVFTNDEHNFYAGNMLAHEPARRAAVARWFPEPQLGAVFDALRSVVGEVFAPAYDGILGVDMLVADDGTLAVMEVNLRKTMGYVANTFADRYLAPGSEGTFRVVNRSALPAKALSMPIPGDGSVLVEDRRLVSAAGLPLTPPASDLVFVASVNRL